MNGVSDTTKKKLYGEYGEYKPSASVTEAQRIANDYAANNNPALQPGYTRKQQSSDLLDQYLNRGQYNGNVYTNPLFKNFEANALKNGRIAADNAAAEAAGLSGGYGNSYGVAAAAAANQRYADSINDYALELDQRMYDRWNDETQNMYNRYAAANTDYQQLLQDYYTNRDFYYDRAQQEYANDYGKFSEGRSYWQNLGAQENANYWNERNLAEEQRQYDNSLAEQQRQYNNTFAENQRQYNSSAASKTSGDSTKKSVTDKMYDDALKAYSDGGNSGLDKWYDKYSGRFNDDQLNSILDYVATYGKKTKPNTSTRPKIMSQ